MIESVITWEETSAAVKITPAVMLLVSTGRASIIPKYQLMSPFLEPLVAAAAATEVEEEEEMWFLERKGDRK